MKKNIILLLVSVLIVLVFQSVLFPLQIREEEKTKHVVFNAEGNVKDVEIPVLDISGQVLSMKLRDYLTGVLLCEMPVEFSIEALKAQAIVARTYVLRRMDNMKHGNNAVCTEPNCCQGYKSETVFLESGGTEQEIERVRSAVNDTKGTVLVYKGALIDATYFSCSGGMTEDAVAVWGKDVPYLQATESPGEEIALHHTDVVRYNDYELASLLSVTSDKPPNVWVESISYTAGGGVGDMKICGKTFSGPDLREKLKLYSTAFTITYEGTEFVITSKGYGHRVGMSQYGAEAMARNGATCDEILLHYYKGIELTQYTPAN